MSWEIVCGDVRQLPIAGQFSAALCDPPYHLKGGFMGKKWDADGPDAVAFQPETWAGIAKHLLPGGFVMAFGGSRTWHRLASAMEDSGLVIHPTIGFLGWIYGTGFPKSTRIRRNGDNVPGWEGHRYGLQAMKPALEGIVTAFKPCSTYELMVYLLQNTILLEELLCLSSSAQVAAKSTNQIHQMCRAVVDAFAHGNVERKAWCETATIAASPTGSSQAGLTPLAFAHGNALTPGEKSHFGVAEDLSAKGIGTSGQKMDDTLQNIALSWSRLLEGLEG